MQPATYNQDGVITVHNHEFMEDARFKAAYARGVEAAGEDYQWHWRVHIGLWAAQIAARLDGDFVECGVNRGFLSSSIMQLLDWDTLGRQFYLLDTFRGIDESALADDDHRHDLVQKNEDRIGSGFYVTNVEGVRRNFAQWRNCRIIEGAVPGTLPEVTAARIAFLHIDMNNAAPEVAALEYFWPRLSTGAPVLLDDYAYHGYRPQKLAMDQLAARLGTAIASLPTGQGLLIKTP